MNRVRKLIVALGGVLVAAGDALADGDLSTDEGKVIAGAALVALFVYLVPNDPPEASPLG